MKRKLAVLIDNCVTGIGSALKTNDYVRLLCKCIGNLSLTFISPVRSDYCCNHSLMSSNFYKHSLINCIRR